MAIEILELNEIAPYLQHKVLCEIEEGVCKVLNGIEITEDGFVCYFGEFGEFNPQDVFPVLRPLSDLGKYIRHDGKSFIPKDAIENTDTWLTYSGNNVGAGARISVIDYEKLHKWHFDMHGLIKKGTAIDINKLNPKS